MTHHLLTRFAFQRDVGGIDEVFRTLAFVRTDGVYTRSRWVTSVVVCRAFVDVCPIK